MVLAGNCLPNILGFKRHGLLLSAVPSTNRLDRMSHLATHSDARWRVCTVIQRQNVMLLFGFISSTAVLCPSIP